MTRQAGDAVAHAVTDPDIVPGGYYNLKVLTPPSPVAQDAGLQTALWDATQDIIDSGGDLDGSGDT